jgi:hypothetical protein
MVIGMRDSVRAICSGGSKARQTGVGLASSGSTFQDQSRDAHSTLISTAPRDQGDSEFYGTAIGKV